MGGGAWPFLVGGVICLVNSVNERDLDLLTSCGGWDIGATLCLCLLCACVFKKSICRVQSTTS